MTGIATSAASSRARNASSVMYYSVYLCRERRIPNRSKTSDLGLPFPVPWPFPKCYTTTIAAPARFSRASVRSGCSSPIPGRLSAFTRHGHIHGRCYSSVYTYLVLLNFAIILALISRSFIIASIVNCLLLSYYKHSGPIYHLRIFKDDDSKTIRREEAF